MNRNVPEHSKNPSVLGKDLNFHRKLDIEAPKKAAMLKALEKDVYV